MKTSTKPKLKLIGVNGNAFNVIALARRTARKAGWTEEQIKEYTKEATASDYNHVLTTTMKFFDVK